MNSLLVHSIIFSYLSFAYFYCETKLQLEGYKLHVLPGYHRHFFTSWNFGLQTYFFGISLIADLLGLVGLKYPSQLKFLLSIYFHGIILPSSLSVSCVFWSIYNYKRDLVWPREADLILPFWMNHILHTATTVNALIELFTVNHMSVNRSIAYKILSAIYFTYILQLLVIRWYFGMWMYPLFDKLSAIEFITTIIGLHVFMKLVQELGYVMNERIWLSQIKSQ